MCMTPYIVKHRIKGQIPVPCGKCPQCIKQRQSAWSFRLMQEEKVSLSARFITLTYDTEHIPIMENGGLSLDKRDVQLFLKRLRKVNRDKIKYYAVGEYGGQFNRPHYHILLFNADIKTIQPSWNKGNVHYGNVTGASIGYVLKYMENKQQSLGQNVQKPFSLMSKGLGKSYIKPKIIEWHKADLENRMYCQIEKQKMTMPRYYKQKMYTDEERKKIALYQKFEIEKRKIDLEEKYQGDYQWDKLQSELAAFSKI